MHTYDVTLKCFANPGNERKAAIFAATLKEAKEEAERKHPGFKAVSAAIAAEKAGRNDLKRMPRKEAIIFSQNMARMLKADIKLADALGFYVNGHQDERVRRLLTKVQRNISLGSETHMAFQTTGAFDSRFCGVLRAGTSSGRLHKAFDDLATELKHEDGLQKALIKAVAMPIAVFLFMIAVFIVSQLFMVPKIESMLKSLHQTPDMLSRIIFGSSHIVKVIWFPCILSGIGFVIAIVLCHGFRLGIIKLLMSRWGLLRKLVMALRQGRFLCTLHMLYGNGIKIEEALEISAGVMAGTEMEPEIRCVRNGIRNEGLHLSDSMRRYLSCDAQVPHLISIGERSGLADQFEALAVYYKEVTNDTAAAFTNVVMLLALFGAASTIIFTVVGTYMPLLMVGANVMQSSAM
jgi:type II secretory pathway component PulF